MKRKLFNEQVEDNPLRSKTDVKSLLVDILTPAMDVLSRSTRRGRFRISDSGAVYIQDKTEIEGFMRLLWGLGPFFSNYNNIDEYPEWYEVATQGILAGTNPVSKDYWGGDLGNYDQLFVEMGALVAFLYETKDKFWNTLSEMKQKEIIDWMDQVNYKVVPKTNWLFFKAMVNKFITDSGYKDNSSFVTECYRITNSHYLNNGWSYDGYKDQIDNYIPFAYQFFTLLTVGLTNWKSDQAHLLKSRAKEFVPSYANWFAADGAALPYGRSLDYRFAQAAFWAAYAYAHVEMPSGYKIGDIKHLLLNNLRWWFKQHIFTTDGLIPIGYTYPNMVFAEGYNGPASAYWALKTFIFYALPDDDPFWASKENDDFKFSKVKLELEPRMLIVHSKSGNEVQAFTAGQHSHEHAHGEAKYEKYVYSTTFGFSVPKGSVLLKQGAYDSTLAVSESDNFWHTAFKYNEYKIHNNYIYSQWKPWNNVEINNFIVPLMPWHIRIHQIDTEREMHVAEGSFSAPDYGTDDQYEIKSTLDNSVFYKTKAGITGLVGLSKELSVELAEPEPNTSLYFPKTKLPLQTGVLHTGKYTLISLYLGDRDLESLSVDGTIRVPNVSLIQNQLIIKFDSHTEKITFDEF
ncbi:DUF2264 domain-containing protein [Oenococcus sp. UCMA 17063]|nr:DUF2264 domain-containing protein [Oenococcus sp. UCMA 17063]